MGEGPPEALWVSFAVVATWPVLLLPVALAMPVPEAPNGAPPVPGTWPLAPLLAENEATGLPAFESVPLLLPVALNPGVPDPVAESLPSDVVWPPNVVVPWL